MRTHDCYEAASRHLSTEGGAAAHGSILPPRPPSRRCVLLTKEEQTASNLADKSPKEREALFQEFIQWQNRTR